MVKETRCALEVEWGIERIARGRKWAEGRERVESTLKAGMKWLKNGGGKVYYVDRNDPSITSFANHGFTTTSSTSVPRMAPIITYPTASTNTSGSTA